MQPPTPVAGAGISGSDRLERIDPQVRKGSIFVYRAFDVAQEIDLAAAERILSQGTGIGPGAITGPSSSSATGSAAGAAGKSRLTFARMNRYALVMRNAPVRLALGESTLRLGTETVIAETSATVWDYGVISIAFQIPIPTDATFSQLIPRSMILNGDPKGTEEIDQIARRRSQELVTLLQGAMKQPTEWKVFEDYVIFYFEELNGIRTAQDLIHNSLLPELILGEPPELLSAQSRSAILENHYQYAANDLVVIDWNTAVVLEPSGQRDIMDVLEFALTHLLEVRYYDDLLDTRLAELYDAIEIKRGRTLQGYFSRLSHEANSRYLEFSEFTERVDNSLKIVGDFYLAVIFRGAMRRFRVQDWQSSITRKMNLLARVSELLQGEINVFRGHMLELTVIFLILFEIVSAILHRA